MASNPFHYHPYDSYTYSLRRKLEGTPGYDDYVMPETPSFEFCSIAARLSGMERLYSLPPLKWWEALQVCLPEEYRHLSFIKEHMVKVVTEHVYYYFQHQMDSLSPFSKERMMEFSQLMDNLEAAGWISEHDQDCLNQWYHGVLFTE